MRYKSIITDKDRNEHYKKDCLYCEGKLGEEHGFNCVCRKRTVVVRLEIEYVIEVPESWTPEYIDFHRNKSSWCCDNGIDEINEMINRAGDNICATCNKSKYFYVREATKKDEENNFLFNNSKH